MARAAGKNGASARKGAVAEKAVPEEKLERLAKACAHQGDVEGVERILDQICARGEPLSLNHYHAVVHACAQAGDVVRAQGYLRQMAEVGLAPTAVTYNLVINACASKGNVAEAEMWVLHMKKRGLAPTEVTYGTICKALARVGNIKRIEEIMAQLEREGLVLNEYFFASLISACGACDPPNLPRAERVPAEMVARGISPKSVKRALERIVGSKRAHQLLAEQAYYEPTWASLADLPLFRPPATPATQSTDLLPESFEKTDVERRARPSSISTTADNKMSSRASSNEHCSPAAGTCRWSDMSEDDDCDYCETWGSLPRMKKDIASKSESSAASTCSDPPAAPSTVGSWASGSPAASRAASLFGSEPPAMPAGVPDVRFRDRKSVV